MSEGGKTTLEERFDIDRYEEYYSTQFETVPLRRLLRRHLYNYTIIGVSFLIILLSALLRGGDSRPSVVGFETCSSATWKVLVFS